MHERPDERTLGVFGKILLLGGLGHSGGITYLYLTAGPPDANRVALDLWVALAQLLGGGFYLVALRSVRKGERWRPWALSGAVTTIVFTISVLPVLFSRAPFLFRIPAIVYLFWSLLIVANLLRAKNESLHHAG